MLAIGQQVTLVSDFSYVDIGACGSWDIQLPKCATGVVVDIPDALNTYCVVHMNGTYPCLVDTDGNVALEPDQLI